MSSVNTTRFGLLRHAPTDWNEKRKIQGQQNSPLSLRGREAAARWGDLIRPMGWQRILCSDLGRVRATIGLLALCPDLPVHPDARLREQDWGQWTGLTMAQLKDRHLEELRSQEGVGWQFTPPGGESRRTVLARSLAAMEDAARSWPGQSVLVVCHEGVIKCLVYHLLGRKFLPQEPPVLQPSCLHLLAMCGRTLYVEQINHLPLNGRGGTSQPCS